MVDQKIPEIEGVEYKLNGRGKPVSGVIILDFPLNDHNPPIEKLNMRRMKAGDSLAGEQIDNPSEAGMALFAELTGVSLDVIKELDNDDFQRLGEALAPLMGKLLEKVMEEQMILGMSQLAGESSLPKLQ